MKPSVARVLLTGAYGGIGKEIAAALVHAGAQVMLSGRSPARLSACARALERQSNGRSCPVQWHAADLTNPAALLGLGDSAARWGCNVLVNNAGQPSFGRIEDIAAQSMQQVLQANLLAPMVLTQSLLPHLLGQPHAQVICVGSVLGAIGLPGYSVYSASKFGLRGFAQALRRELADTSVRVQYLGPRSTLTTFNNDAVVAYNRATRTAMDPPELVARALLDVLESQAAECFIGFPEKLAARLNGLAPALFDGAFAHHRQSLPTSGNVAALPPKPRSMKGPTT